MADDAAHRDLATTMEQFNRAWLGGRVEDLAPMVHPDVVMALPGFDGTIQGRDQFLAGFRDFCEHAAVQEFRQDPLQINAIDETAVVTFRYEMVYERSGQRYRSTGRDLWVFRQHGDRWIGVWRTMLDTDEHAA